MGVLEDGRLSISIPRMRARMRARTFAMRQTANVHSTEVTEGAGHKSVARIPLGAFFLCSLSRSLSIVNLREKPTSDGDSTSTPWLISQGTADRMRGVHRVPLDHFGAKKIRKLSSVSLSLCKTEQV